MKDSTTPLVSAGQARPGLRGPAFSPFAPRLEPFDPTVSDGDLTDDDPTEKAERPDDEDEGRAGPG